MPREARWVDKGDVIERYGQIQTVARVDHHWPAKPPATPFVRIFFTDGTDRTCAPTETVFMVRANRAAHWGLA